MNGIFSLLVAAAKNAETVNENITGSLLAVEMTGNDDKVVMIPRYVVHKPTANTIILACEGTVQGGANSYLHAQNHKKATKILGLIVF